MRRGITAVLAALLFFLCLGCVTPGAYAADRNTQTDVAKPAPTVQEKPVLKGWQETKNGKKQYYGDGGYVTDPHRIDSGT